MILWRISRFHDLSGRGTVKTYGRWHLIGTRMVYTADCPAAALLEICAHTSAEDLPRTFTLLKISGPDIASEEIELGELPANWATQMESTQLIGAAWLESRRSSVLRVPSVLVPETWNYLLNPAHPDASLFQIERSYDYPFDLRLKG
jgi:RES domain-containing protein